MFLDPEIRIRVDDLTCNEIERLEKISIGNSILVPSGKTTEDIAHMNSQVVRKCLNRWEQVDYEYNIPWMTQVALKKWVSEKDIRIDDPMQTLYPVEPHIYLPISNNTLKNLLVTFTPDEWIFNWFVRNIDEVCTVLATLRETIESWSDILILSNHATWFNLPLIAHCLHRIFGIPQKNIYTILGPAITHSHWSLAGILRYSNVLKTYPNTEKAHTGYPESKQIQKNFFDTITEIFGSKNMNGTSRILLLSPSGTTDTITPDGRILITPPTSGTETLIKLLMRRMELLGFAIGVNDTEIIPIWHSRPQRGKVFAQASAVDIHNWKEELRESVVDESGEVVWYWKNQNVI